MDKEKAKERAWIQHCRLFHPGETDAPVIEKSAINSGFDAGYAAGLSASSGWVAVSERLPAKDEIVQATIRDDDTFNDPDLELLRHTHGQGVGYWVDYTMFFKGDHWFSSDLDGRVECEDVVAWMPLPSPFTPKETV